MHQQTPCNHRRPRGVHASNGVQIVCCWFACCEIVCSLRARLGRSLLIADAVF